MCEAGAVQRVGKNGANQGAQWYYHEDEQKRVGQGPAEEVRVQNVHVVVQPQRIADGGSVWPTQAQQYVEQKAAGENCQDGQQGEKREPSAQQCLR